MLDWLLAAQKRVENKLAKRHLKQGGVLLFDLSSSYFEGHKCSIGKYGKNRDGKRGKEQINYALVCAPDGCPVSVQVFPGNTGDPRALTALARSMRNRFGIDSVAVVGDRGMITSKRIRDDLTPLGLDWITALKKNQIRTLLKVPEKEAEPGEKVEKKPPLCPETLVPDEVNEITAPTLSTRKAHGLPQPAPAERATAQARGTAPGHRKGTAGNTQAGSKMELSIQRKKSTAGWGARSTR